MSTWALQRRILPFLSTADDGTGVAGGDESGRTPPESGLRSSQEIIEALSRLVPEFTRLTNGKSNEALSQPDSDGFWSIVDVMSHILDWERVNHDRVHRLLEEEFPSLPNFDDSLWSVEHNYRDNRPEDVLRELKEHREVLVEELKNLPEEDWHEAGTLEGRGEITLHQLMNGICDHDQKHLEQAQGILA